MKAADQTVSRPEMGAIGLSMFLCALVATIATGLPVYAVLIGVASLFAAAGIAFGIVDARLFAVLPSRLVGLLEHDLLQALPLYALIGALLNRLPLAALLHRAGERLFARSAAAPELAALALGALTAPMNGSVGASLHMLARSVAPALERRHVPPARATATVAVASTLGLVVPPSLVLLLLGDAMMRAHTEAVNVTHAAVRIVNTQDVVRAALVPGALVLATAIGWVAWRGRRRSGVVPAPNAQPRGEAEPPAKAASLSRSDLLTAVVATAVIAGLLGAVAIGRIYAVEAAASGGLLLLAWAAATRRIDGPLLRLVLADAMTLTGLLFALLVAATTFSLVLRGFETDLLIGRWMQSVADRPLLLLSAVLAGFALCSFVLDAFEMVFLVVPIVMPPVLMAVPDPAWVAALTLLVLQLGFLLPPFGYAVVVSRSMMPRPPGMRALGAGLLPHLLLQAAVIVAVLAWPQTTRWTRPLETGSPTAPTSAESAERLMQEAIDAQQKESGEREAPK